MWVGGGIASWALETCCTASGGARTWFKWMIYSLLQLNEIYKHEARVQILHEIFVNTVPHFEDQSMHYVD